MAGFLTGVRRLYLSAYNWAVFVGWFQVFYLALKTLMESGHERVYYAVERPLQLAQTAAVLEILHGLLGITSEVGLIYIALPFIKASEKYCIRLPNKWNFSFDYLYAAVLVLGIYVPGSPHLYTYMLGQRKKALSKAEEALSKAKKA